MNTINVIICDDDQFIHEDIRKLLSNDGEPKYVFNVVNDFYDTLPLKIFLNKNKNSLQKNTLLILDHFFQKRPAGLQSLPEIRNLCPNLPILMLTTSNNVSEFLKASAIYNVEYAEKPITSSNLQFRLQHMVEDTTSNIEAKFNEMFEEIKNIKNGMKDIKSDISNIKTILIDEIPNKIREEKNNICKNSVSMDEYTISKFINDVSNYIKSKIKNNSNIDVCEEEKIFINVFGSNWNKLLDESKGSLVAASVIWKTCESISVTNFDYSGVCISATSALEAELKKTFFENLQNFIIKKYGAPDDKSWKKTFKVWPERLLTYTEWNYEAALRNSRNTPHIELSNNFTMGMLPYLFGKDDKKSAINQCEIMKNRMCEYLRSIVKNEYKENPIHIFTNFINDCENIRNNFRNKAAHIDNISKQEAKFCYNKITDKNGLLMTMFAFFQ